MRCLPTLNPWRTIARENPILERASVQPEPHDCAGQVHPTASSGNQRRPLFKLIRTEAHPKVPRSVLPFPTLGGPAQTPRLRRPGSPHSKQRKPAPATFQADSHGCPSESTAIFTSLSHFGRPSPKPHDCAGQVHPTASSGNQRRPLFKLIRTAAQPKIPRSVLSVPTLGSPAPTNPTTAQARFTPQQAAKAFAVQKSTPFPTEPTRKLCFPPFPVPFRETCILPQAFLPSPPPHPFLSSFHHLPNVTFVEEQRLTRQITWQTYSPNLIF